MKKYKKKTIIMFVALIVFFYSLLLITRIIGHSLFSDTPQLYKEQLIYIGYVASLLILFGMEYFLSRKKQSFLQIYRWCMLAASCSLIIDYGFNDHNRGFSGAFWSDLYDSIVIIFALYILYLVCVKLKEAKGRSDDNQKEEAPNSLDSTSYSFHSNPSLGVDGEDMLRRDEFAQHLGSTLKNRMSGSTENSLTIGLYGPWGSGKSSIFDMIEARYIDKDEIIRFYPWYLGKDYHNIIPEFLKMLLDNLQGRIEKSSESSNKKQDKKLLDQLKNYLIYLTPISIRPPGMIINFKEISSFSKFSKDFEDANTMRNQIIELLKASHYPLVVFIDDLDRLDNKEIQMMFKLVRLVADFPNITYVIAMDEDIVAKSLSQLYSKDYDVKTGLKYIEKFIQVPLYLPQPDHALLVKLFIKGIRPVCEYNKMKISDLFLSQLVSYFKFTPRNIQRLINISMIHFPMLKGEVYPDDLIALLAIKIENPTLFTYIYDHSDLFLGRLSDDAEKSKLIEELKMLSSNYFPLLETVFPRLVNKDINSEEVMNKNKRIGSFVHFWTYFKYAVLERQVSQKDLNHLYNKLLEAPELAHIVYTKLKINSNFEELHLQLRLNIKHDQTELNQNLLLLIINDLSDNKDANYPDVHKSARELVTELLKVLLTGDSSERIIKIIKDYKYDLLLAAEAFHTRIPEHIKKELGDFISSEISFLKLDAYREEDARLILIGSMIDRDNEEIRNNVAKWGSEHDVWRVVAILMDDVLEDDLNMFYKYVAIIEKIPVELIEREVGKFGNIVNEKEAKKEAAYGKDAVKVNLSYAHNRSYEYVEGMLDNMLKPSPGGYQPKFLAYLQNFLAYGDQNRVAASKEKWAIYAERNNGDSNVESTAG